MTSAILVAAGKGTRMGLNVDKLFLELHGCPVVGHAWRRFDSAPCIDEIVLVVRPGTEAVFSELGRRLGLRKPCHFAEGGKERQDSVWNGLTAVSEDTLLVAIHDAARPCTSEGTISAALEAASRTGAAVAAQPITDTVKESEDGRLALRTLDRSRLWTVQTPQCFRLAVIRHALAEVRRRGLIVTDDTAACELVGHPVQLVPSTDPNPKVTRPEDLALIELILSRLSAPPPVPSP
ncbi:MAG TPA: 2-C-methyl-D-erythritol 4-phosphate cytidylyltransferase [Verrucomicrobiae bacterium]